MSHTYASLLMFKSISSLSSSSDFTSCSAAEPQLIQNFVINNLFSALHTHSKTFLSQSCSRATRTVAKQAQCLFPSAFPLVQMLLEGRPLETRVVYDCREIVISFYKLWILLWTEILRLYSPFLSLGCLVLVLVLVSGCQQRTVFVFVYTSTEGIAECLCGGFSPEYWLGSCTLMETGRWVI